MMKMAGLQMPSNGAQLPCRGLEHPYWVCGVEVLESSTVILEYMGGLYKPTRLEDFWSEISRTLIGSMWL